MMFELLLVIKVTLICVIALAAARLARRSRASVRHLLLSGAFVTLPALPVAAWLVPPISIEIPIPGSRSAPITETLYSPEDATTNGNVEPPASSVVTAVQTSIQPSTLVTLAWLTGAALFLLPVVVGLWQLRNIRRSGVSWPRGEEICAELVSGSDHNRKVAVLVHAGISGPMTCGVFRPAIVFPQNAESWTDQAVRRGMIHELEHIVRQDCLMHCVARVAGALYWFHPLVWMCWRKLGLEAERACDDAVLARQPNSEATDYADQLVKLATQIKTASKMPLLAMANRSDLSTRVSAVLDAGQQRGKADRFHIAGLVMLCTIAVGVVSPLHAVIVSSAGQPPGGRQEFEVASIKTKGTFKGPAMVGVDFLPGGRVTAENAHIGLLIMAAYGISSKQMDFEAVAQSKLFGTGVPDVFDIDARAGANALPDSAPPEERRRQHQRMLQSLLADRFKLTLHIEKREMPIYALVVGPNGPRLKRSPEGRTCPDGARCGRMSGGPASGIRGLDVEIAELVDTLTGFEDREVVDRTGLKGKFDIELPSWTRPWIPRRTTDAPATERLEDPNDPTILNVIQTLGLRLQSTRGPADIYVIDHVEEPTPN